MPEATQTIVSKEEEKKEEKEEKDVNELLLKNSKSHYSMTGNTSNSSATKNDAEENDVVSLNPHELLSTLTSRSCSHSADERNDKDHDIESDNILHSRRKNQREKVPSELNLHLLPPPSLSNNNNNNNNNNNAMDDMNVSDLGLSMSLTPLVVSMQHQQQQHQHQQPLQAVASTESISTVNTRNTKQSRRSNNATNIKKKSPSRQQQRPKTYKRQTSYQSTSYSRQGTPRSGGAGHSSTGGSPTAHVQTFILTLAFFAIWSPQNLMAPNLTQMADYFHFTPQQRDAYLGANIAFATGVLSLPLSAWLGFFADVTDNRIHLFSYTVFFGGLFSIFTGASRTYTQLYFNRFACGGCMSGSVPIAFSILGDLFHAKDRNAASSGLTAMMGTGILMGQVFAGTVGDVVGWQYPFYFSGALSIVMSIIVIYLVDEPIRGGKEVVLQDMIAKGSAYDRKLSFEKFYHAMTQNNTNIVLMLQGFFTSIPWGIIFTFLNDYLSQEQGLTVPASTFLVFWFGIGSAVGGIWGGMLGSKAMRMNRVFLPLFMAATTLAGIFPFLGLLDMNLKGHTLLAVFLSFMGGMVANLASVNVRPCLLNVNPPEARGATMTAANLMINVARGFGPSLIIMGQTFFGVDRQYSFNFAVRSNVIVPYITFSSIVETVKFLTLMFGK